MSLLLPLHFVLFLTLLAIRCVDAADYSYDLVVFGATPSGIMAAVEASRHDLHKMRVAIVCPEPYIGGMVAGGLGHTDTGDKNVIGGLALEFFQRVDKKYGGSGVSWNVEPHVATQVFNDLISESDVDVFVSFQLSEDADSVVKTGSTINRIKVDTPNGVSTFTAALFIDASYEGTLMAQAGVSYFVGREGSAEYNESYAGYRGPGGNDNNGMDFNVKVDPYFDNGTLIPHVQPAPTTKVGDPDKLVQAYNFRLCVTRSKTNRVPFAKPANYDPASFVLVTRLSAAIQQQQHKTPTFSTFVANGGIPNGKFDMNNNGAVSTDLIGENAAYPDADRKTRQHIWQQHYDYQAGLLYFLANDPSLPTQLRTAVSEYGLCKDEFVETNNWPWQLYVREARKMRSDFVFSEADVVRDKKKTDTIGMGSYPIDSHNTQRFPTDPGTTHNEGDMYMSSNGVFQMPYRVLIPRKTEATNLLVSVCVSSTHIGYGPLRLEPQYMILGQAAGLAAAEAHYYQLAVQDVNISDIQTKLRSEHAILEGSG